MDKKTLWIKKNYGQGKVDGTGLDIEIPLRTFHPKGGIFYLGTEIHGFIFNKDTAWLRMDITTALRDYGLLRKFTA